VMEADPLRRLKLTWKVPWIAEGALPECHVTYDIQLAGALVKLTMTEHHPTPIDPTYLEGGKQGWPMILSGLKTLLETGSPLPVPVPQPPG
jgi:Activator of Hsp90 ATPase homolog 1-like protein